LGARDSVAARAAGGPRAGGQPRARTWRARGAGQLLPLLERWEVAVDVVRGVCDEVSAQEGSARRHALPRARGARGEVGVAAEARLRRWKLTARGVAWLDRGCVKNQQRRVLPLAGARTTAGAKLFSYAGRSQIHDVCQDELALLPKWEGQDSLLELGSRETPKG
jgi:hypothetical protein